VNEPTFFPTAADFRGWLEANDVTEPDLLIGFWKSVAALDRPQARDQAS
jgi:hypothetical protein